MGKNMRINMISNYLANSLNSLLSGYVTMLFVLTI